MRVPALKSAPSTEKRAPAHGRKYGIGEPRASYLKVPRDFRQILIKQRKLSGGLQRDLLMLIMESTWGAKDRPEWGAISLKTFSEECGDVSKGSVCRDLQDMELRGLIESKTGDGCKGLKLYRVTQRKWKDAPAYTADIETAAECEENSEDDDEPHPAGRLVIKPNAGPAFVSTRLALKDREPVDFRIAYTSSFAQPLAITSSVTDDVVTIHLHGAGKANTRVSRETHTDIEQKAKIVAIKRVSDFEVTISALQTSLFDRPFDSSLAADKKFLKQILQASGDTVPAAEFEAYCREEIHAMKRRRKSIYPGILISLAAQAARKFAAAQYSLPPYSPPEPAPLPSAAEIEALSYCVKCNDTGNDGTWDHGRFSPYTKPFRTCPVCEGRKGAPKAEAATC